MTTNNFVYFGLNLNILNFENSVFINSILYGLVEIGGILLSWWIIETKLGRKGSNCILMSLCGGSLLISIFTTNFYLILGLSLIGKLCISATFMIIYQQTAELFPTCLRNQSFSMGNCVMSLFSIFAPYISSLGHNGLWIPLTIFGSLCMTSAIFQMNLPETLNQPLPQNIEESELLGSKTKLKLKSKSK